MNKKSLILSLLLCAGLTPQKTQTIFPELVFYLSAMPQVAVTLSAVTLYQVLHPKRASNFIKSSEQIVSYAACITISQREKEGRSILVEKKISTKNPYTLIENIKTIASCYEKKRLIRVDVTPSIECTDGKTYSLHTIRFRNYSLSRLTRALRAAIIVQDQWVTYNTKIIALTSFVWGCTLFPFINFWLLLDNPIVRPVCNFAFGLLYYLLNF